MSGIWKGTEQSLTIYFLEDELAAALFVSRAVGWRTPPPPFVFLVSCAGWAFRRACASRGERICELFPGRTMRADRFAGAGCW